MIDKTARIHPSSIIEDGAVIGANVTIGPFCCIGADVEIGEGTEIKSHVVINGHTKIGRDNQIFQFASIGEINQDLKYKGEPTRVEIGDRNRIRESVTIHRGTAQDTGVTRIGNDNLLMINAHVAHDCVIGNHCIIANNGTLAGHVTLDDYVILGGLSAVHQFCRIGEHVMVGGCSGVAQDIPPFLIAQGNHVTAFGLNAIGLKRRGFDKDDISALQNAYKVLYRSNLTLAEAKVQLAELAKENVHVKTFADFLDTAERVIIRP